MAFRRCATPVTVLGPLHVSKAMTDPDKTLERRIHYQDRSTQHLRQLACLEALSGPRWLLLVHPRALARGQQKSLTESGVLTHDS